MKKCKKCEINYVMNENEDYCPLCKAKIVDVPIDTGIRKTGIDNIKTKHIGNILNVGLPYGTAAKRIYLECCEDFGFDKNDAGKFDKQKKLYASNVTKEGYGVWFIAHSNYTDFNGSNWSNDFIDGDDVIKEHWKDIDIPGFTIKENLNTRVVFAKKYDDKGDLGYYFMGVYEYYQTIGHDRYFRRISKTYPVK